MVMNGMDRRGLGIAGPGSPVEAFLITPPYQYRRRPGLLIAWTLLGLLAIALWWHLRAPRSMVGTFARNRPESSSAPLEEGANAPAGSTRSASIAGTVTDPDRKPVVSARVCASLVTYDGRMYEAASCTNTDGSGRYTLGSLGARVYRVSATATGFMVGSPTDSLLSLGADESRAGVDIVLQRDGAMITGSVVDATGGPVPHAKVRAERAETTPFVVDIEADALGHFALSFPPGMVALYAVAEAYAPAHVAVLAPSVDVRLVLIPGARARGVVVSKTDGQPVPNVEVRAVALGRSVSPLLGTSASDASGAFDIKGLEPGPYNLVASGEGWYGELASPIGLGLGRTAEDLRIEVSPAAQVVGRVLFVDGDRPCEHGHVALGPPDLRHPVPEERPNAPPRPRNITQVGADIEPQGVVRFRAVPPGHYYVSVQCADNLLKQGPQELDVQAKTLANLVWKVGPGSSLTVVTVDERDRPLAGAEFLVQLPQFGPAGRSNFVAARSDLNGRYEVRNLLSAGTYEVAPIQPFEGERVRVDVHDGAESVDVKLRIAGSASIAIAVHAPGGKAIDGLAIFADSIGSAGDAGNGPPPRFAATRLGEGRYRVAPLKPGRYEVHVEDGVNPPKSGGQYVLASGEVADSSIELDRGARIRGRVVDEDGVAFGDAWVSATAERGTSADPNTVGAQESGSSRVLTDLDGQFEIEGISDRDASYTLRAELPNGGLGVKRGVKAPDSDVLVTVRAPGSLAGNVGGTCGGSAVVVTAANADVQQRTTQHVSPGGGPFLLRGVVPGHIELIALCDDGSGIGHVSTDLSPKQNLTGLRLELEPHSGGGIAGGDGLSVGAVRSANN